MKPAEIVTLPDNIFSVILIAAIAVGMGLITTFHLLILCLKDSRRSR